MSNEATANKRTGWSKLARAEKDGMRVVRQQPVPGVQEGGKRSTKKESASASIQLLTGNGTSQGEAKKVFRGSFLNAFVNKMYSIVNNIKTEKEITEKNKK